MEPSFETLGKRKVEAGVTAAYEGLEAHREAWLMLRALALDFEGGDSEAPDQALPDPEELQSVARMMEDADADVRRVALDLVMMALAKRPELAAPDSLGGLISAWLESELLAGKGEGAIKFILSRRSVGLSREEGGLILGVFDRHAEEALAAIGFYGERARTLAGMGLGGSFSNAWLKKLEEIVPPGTGTRTGTLAVQCARSLEDSPELVGTLLQMFCDAVSRSEGPIMLDNGCRAGVMRIFSKLASDDEFLEKYGELGGELAARLSQDMLSGLIEGETRETAIEVYKDFGLRAGRVAERLEAETDPEKRGKMYTELDVWAFPINRLAQAAGLPWGKVWADWEIAVGKTYLENHLQVNGTAAGRLALNAERLAELHAALPEAASALYAQFGISCFGRYPLELLKEQFELKDETEAVAVPVFLAVDDHNGVMYQGEDLYESIREQLRSCGKEIGSDISLRFIEFRSPVDCLRRIAAYRSSYAAKVPLVFFGAHGERTGMHAGGKGDGQISVADLSRPSTGIVGMLRDDATLVLNSCSTGQEGGVAEALSEALGVTVIAPDGPAALSSVRLGSNSSGGIAVKVAYSHQASPKAFAPSSGSDEEDLARVRQLLSGK